MFQSWILLYNRILTRSDDHPIDSAMLSVKHSRLDLLWRHSPSCDFDLNIGTASLNHVQLGMVHSLRFGTSYLNNFDRPHLSCIVPPCPPNVGGQPAFVKKNVNPHFIMLHPRYSATKKNWHVSPHLSFKIRPVPSLEMEIPAWK